MDCNSFSLLNYNIRSIGANIDGFSSLLSCVKLKFQPFSESNLNRLNELITNTNWNCLMDLNDINKCTSSFVNKLNELYCKCFPMKTKYVSEKRIENRWITTDVKP